jgi:hypothetical protein
VRDSGPLRGFGRFGLRLRSRRHERYQGVPHGKDPIRVGSGPGLVLTGEVRAIANATHVEPRLNESSHSEISILMTVSVGGAHVRFQG